MNILSLFDGMSCGQIALNRSGIKYNKYYASEIDKYSIQVTQKNYSNTIQLGDITKWQEWDIEKPDLIMGGSPCQGFSFAGKRLNFNDDRSKLFFTFLEILNHYKPKYFLLENVMMDEIIGREISRLMGVNPVIINSALVSAQNRKRLYWTNISGTEKTLFGYQIGQPKDKKIYLKDVLEDNLQNVKNKSNSVRSSGRGSKDRHEWDNVYDTCKQVGVVDPNGYELLNRIYSIKGKSPTLQTGQESPKIKPVDINYRKLTPIECERLQTVPDNYTDRVSNTQRYKMLGNGWTVDIICHIFKGL